MEAAPPAPPKPPARPRGPGGRFISKAEWVRREEERRWAEELRREHEAAARRAAAELERVRAAKRAVEARRRKRKPPKVKAPKAGRVKPKIGKRVKPTEWVRVKLRVALTYEREQRDKRGRVVGTRRYTYESTVIRHCQKRTWEAKGDAIIASMVGQAGRWSGGYPIQAVVLSVEVRTMRKGRGTWVEYHGRRRAGRKTG